jgi:predicted dienelactone hydrolase
MAIGCRRLAVTDPVRGGAVPAWALYPAGDPAAERIEQFGPYPLSVAIDAPAAGAGLPVVAISHGNNGSPWTSRDLARHLAGAGFAVLLVEHPGNSRADGSAAGTIANLENRPRQLGLALDALLGEGALAGHLAAGRIGLIGHSIGGYTALALAGGRPTAFPNESADGQPRPVPVARDPRIGALVLLAPATVWFMAEGALAGVDLPILMRSGELDTIAPPALHAAIVLRGVADPARVDHRVVRNAGHFSFQSPFPPAMTRPDFPPSQDPPGFDRAAYQPVLHGEVEAFLRAALTAP